MEDEITDQQLFLLAMLLGTIFFYAYTIWVDDRLAHFLGIVTIAISFGILKVAPSGNVFTVACVALAVSVVLWRFSMIYVGNLPGTLNLAKKKGSSIQWGLSEFIGWGEPIVQTGITVFVLVAHTQDLIAERSIIAPLGAILALFYPSIMGVAFHDSQQLATTGHLIRSEHILIQHGIYGHLRHPMYFAAFWLWIATAIALRSIWILVFWAGYALPALLIYVRAEEKQIQSVFGDQYESYKRRVSGFIPKKPLALIHLLLFSKSADRDRQATGQQKK